MKKLAFCFLCKNRLKNIELWKKYFLGHENKFNTYFHFSEYDKKIKKELPNMKIVPHQKTSWGNIYNAIFSLYKISFDDNNFKYILLSESCIPVKSFSLTYKFLTNNQDSFLCFQPHRPKTEWEKATLIQSLERYVNNAKKSKDFLYKVAISDWFYNETWNILNKKHIEIILNNHSIIKEFESMSCFAYDENIVSYILNINNELMNIKNIKTTFVDWQRAVKDKSGRHPFTFKSINDIDILNFKNYLFARKFDDIVGLENKIIFKD